MTDLYIGVDLGGTKTEVVVLDANSIELFRHRLPTPAGDYQGILATIKTLVDRAEQTVGVSDLPVGIGIPGSISGQTGLVKNANTQCLNGQPLASDLSERLQRSVPVVNDANCLAVSEAVDGAAAGYDWVFAAILGTGCGSGLAYRGQAVDGANGVAGEWGHVPMPGVSDRERQARPCFCGQSGCVETFLSGTGLQKAYLQMSGFHKTAEEIFRLADHGDQLAGQCLDVYCEQLLQGLTMVINIIDPGIIVLGGGVSNIDRLYPYLQTHLPERVFGGECHTRVVKARHGDSSGVRGAAWLNIKDKNL